MPSAPRPGPARVGAGGDRAPQYVGLSFPPQKKKNAELRARSLGSLRPRVRPGRSEAPCPTRPRARPWAPENIFMQPSCKRLKIGSADPRASGNPNRICCNLSGSPSSGDSGPRALGVASLKKSQPDSRGGSLPPYLLGQFQQPTLI